MDAKIKGLSRQRKLELVEMLRAKRARLLDKRDTYMPNEGQSAVHLSTVQTRLVFSGNGAGKTGLATHEAMWAALGWNPVRGLHTAVPSRVIVLLDHPEKVTDVWLPEINKWFKIDEEWLRKRGKPYVSQIQFPNGSELIFMFHDQNPMVFESIEYDVLIADEPMPRHVWIALRRGGRKKGRRPRFLLVGTPIASSWMRREIYEPWRKGELQDVECFRFHTKVNEANLAEGYIEEFSRHLSESERQVRLGGAFFDVGGLALSHLFDRSIHLIPPFEWPRTDPVVVAIDPHPSKAHHAVMLGSDRDGYLYYIKEMRHKMVPKEFAHLLKEFYKGYRVLDIVVDSLGSADGTGGDGFKSFIQVLNDEGVRCRATRWSEKDDEDFIERIRGVIAIPTNPNNFGDFIPKLRIFRGNPGIVNDIENVQWAKFRNSEENKPKLNIENTDYLSCLKYALACGVSAQKAEARVYVPTKGAETYGYKRESTERTRMRLKLTGTSAEKKRRMKEDDWDDF